MIFPSIMLTRLFPLARAAASAPKVVKRNYMHGKGSRMENNSLPFSLTMKGLKIHYDLIPLFVVVGGAMVAVCIYIGRLAAVNPDVAWRKQETPQNDYSNKDFKLIRTHPPEKDVIAFPKELLEK